MAIPSVGSSGGLSSLFQEACQLVKAAENRSFLGLAHHVGEIHLPFIGEISHILGLACRRGRAHEIPAFAGMTVTVMSGDVG
ncbi:hypothetical protein [Allosphingosinicella flava]|uniref:hypothetical protein n=1 Tax=Allosphingosinicella flava TaxID=2771430 RepID=UPI001A9CA888|nr:hypothetical protein [Sphingosinicella flava]